MSVAIDRIAEARRIIKQAEATLKSESSVALDEALKELFSDQSVRTVRWAAKTSEYNDEGMYPGIAGPVVNFEGHDYNDHWTWLAGYNYQATADDSKAAKLKTLLDLIGEEALTDIYGDEQIVTVTRLADGSLEVESEYVGY